MWIFPYAFQRTCNYKASWCLLSSKESCSKFSFRKNDNENKSSSSGRNNNNNKQTNKQTKTRSVVFITYTGPNHPTHFLKLSWGLHLAVENRIWKHSTQVSFLKFDSLPSLTANSLRLNILVGMRSAVSGEKLLFLLLCATFKSCVRRFPFLLTMRSPSKLLSMIVLFLKAKLFFFFFANSLSLGSYLIKFSSLSPPKKIEELTAGSDERGCAVFFSSDLAVSSSIFVGAEREENLKYFFLFVYCSQAMAQTFPRGFPDVLGFSLFIPSIFFIRESIFLRWASSQRARSHLSASKLPMEVIYIVERLAKFTYEMSCWYGLDKNQSPLLCIVWFGWKSISAFETNKKNKKKSGLKKSCELPSP